ncbi:LysR family transcriptional regulator [Sulfitobacter sediminilitoris]
MELHWDDLKIFLAVARAGSLTGAARRLRVSQPTVSRKLAAMEQAFGVKLFERNRDGYQLSGPGAEIYETANQVGEDISEIERRLSGRDMRLEGQVTVTCTEVMSNLYLAPHFARFLQAHPGIELSVNCTFQNLSLSRGEADVAVRNTSRPPETLIGRKLVKVATAVYVANDMIGCTGEKAAPRHWIGWQDEAYSKLLITSHFPDAVVKHRVDDMQTMRSMVRNGVGIAALPCYMADPDPGLSRLFPDPIFEGALDIWVLRHPAVRQVARLRLMTEFLADTILSDRDLFEGERPGEIEVHD